MGDKGRGLYQKYEVSRVDGQPIDYCIVLELTDSNAWEAIRVYADAVKRDGYETLGWELESLEHYYRTEGRRPTLDETKEYIIGRMRRARRLQAQLDKAAGEDGR